MRYRGQSYEIETALDRAAIDGGDVAGIARAFHAAHHAAYDHSDPEAEVQVINLRPVVAGTSPKPDLRPQAEEERQAEATAELAVYLDGAARRRSFTRARACGRATGSRGPRS